MLIYYLEKILKLDYKKKNRIVEITQDSAVFGWLGNKRPNLRTFRFTILVGFESDLAFHRSVNYNQHSIPISLHNNLLFNTIQFYLLSLHLAVHPSAEQFNAQHNGSSCDDTFVDSGGATLAVRA